MKTLGKVDKTSRGFELIEFKDRYGVECSLQASSLAEYEKPGTSAVWLGCQKNCRHSSTGEEMAPRMHLDRKQVSALINHLNQWLKRDSFKL